ncbi:MurR/RpiR family transcriptional regulator [Pseudomonas defluvii]|jgi:DNA-binding MurR/RpiR family transcriptional regulator|uniref:MurR/RpiR family transcriptional regulator n=1 Tax=Pseudomonas defluvii TaxID=1876757 RepID=UPI0008119C9F|nr:MurR/RpiR family transcriptional regulator [Pseudomonas defluvii]
MQQLKQRLTLPETELTPAERKVVRALLDDYPRVGLGPMARLAKRASVSDPTILRLVKKLGFGGYGEFQDALLADVDDRMRSPRTLLVERREHLAGSDAWNGYLENAAQNLQQTQGLTQSGDIEILCGWLLDTRLRVHCHGGRFSRFLASYLVTHLRLLRPGCHLLDDNAQLADVLYDLGRQDLLLLFDYRRYQSQALLLAEQAKARGVRLVLFTDIYASPLRELADLIISSPVESLSPFDTLVPAMAQVEALVNYLVSRMDDQLDERLGGIDALRTTFGSHLLEE